MGITDHRIVSAACPTSICCQLDDGCDFVEDTDSLCAANRDADSSLCSRCITGYSESMNSANCTLCDKTVRWEYLVLPICLAVGLMILMLFTNREETEADRQCSLEHSDTLRDATIGYLKRLKNGDGKVTLMSLAKIVVYYEQVI